MKTLKLKRKRNNAEHEDLDLSPMLSLMVTIIPLLLASAVFYKIRIFDSSVFPTSNKVEQKDGADELPVTYVEMGSGSKAIILVKKGEKTLFRTEKNIKELDSAFKSLIVRFPEMKSLKISSDKSVSYKDLILVFDKAKQPIGEDKKSLFDDVSLDDIFKG